MLTKMLNGREVSISTHWWASNSVPPLVLRKLGTTIKLYCIHGFLLDEECNDCNTS